MCVQALAACDFGRAIRSAVARHAVQVLGLASKMPMLFTFRALDAVCSQLNISTTEIVHKLNAAHNAPRILLPARHTGTQNRREKCAKQNYTAKLSTR